MNRSHIHPMRVFSEIGTFPRAQRRNTHRMNIQSVQSSPILQRTNASKRFVLASVAIAFTVFNRPWTANGEILPLPSVMTQQSRSTSPFGIDQYSTSLGEDYHAIYGQRQRPSPPLEFAHGTTTISFTFSDGIIAAVDSRASIGNFIGSKTTKKILEVNKNILGTMAGKYQSIILMIESLNSSLI
jgi:hypothetical protein